MSGLLSLVREVVGIVWPTMVPAWALFWGCARVAFILCAAVVWWREYSRRRSAEARILALETALADRQPRLTPAIVWLNARRVERVDAAVGFFAQIAAILTIKNQGGPTTLHEWSLSLDFIDRRLEGEILHLPNVETYQLQISAGQSVNLPTKEYLPTLGLAAPIPTSGSIQGFLIAVFPSVTKEDFYANAKIAVSFQDVSGKKYKVESLIEPAKAKEPLSVEQFRSA